MTRAKGARFTAEILHDGRNFLASLRWKPGHGGPQEIAGDSEEVIEFRLRSLDPSVQFHVEDTLRRRKVTR